MARCLAIRNFSVLTTVSGRGISCYCRVATGSSTGSASPFGRQPKAVKSLFVLDAVKGLFATYQGVSACKRPSVNWAVTVCARGIRCRTGDENGEVGVYVFMASAANRAAANVLAGF